MSSEGECIPVPLQPPANDLAIIAIARLEDIPHSRHETIVIDSPMRTVGLRPNLSEARPQIIAVVHCERENAAEVMPAHHATSFL